MKAVDIAKKNNLALKEVENLCKELNIQTSGEDKNISDKDLSLVEKKIQVFKAVKENKPDQLKPKKKIKLKRKVHVPKEQEEVKEETPKKEVSDKKVVPATESRIEVERKPLTDRKSSGNRPQGNRPDGNRSNYNNNRPQGNRPDGNRQNSNYKPSGNRPAGSRPDNNRPQQGGGANRPHGNRPDGNRPNSNYRSNSNYRPAGNRPAGSRPDNNRPQQGGSTNRPQGNRPDGNRPNSNYRPAGNRPAGSRPDNNRPQGNRPQGNRPQGNRPAGHRPFAQSQGGSKPGFSKPEPAAGLAKNDGFKKKKPKVVAKGAYNNRKKPAEKNYNVRKNAPIIKKEYVAPTEISITENVSVGELAKKLNIKANEVIAKLMKLGVMATINQVIDSETVEILVDEYGTNVKVVSLYDETVIKSDEVDESTDHSDRSPVVTVMGHVDHGKTKLLDAIRNSDVADGEHGGITQHIGAYKVKVGEKEITFLDTPGHAAFTTMRARGASITDIVILVVAANDGVMPQTKEAISHAKEAGVPIVVAINKIDLPDANPAKVRQELSSFDLVPEEWGGTTLFVEISAKENKNISELLEMVLMQSEMLELKANAKLRAKGSVIESRLDPGRGAVTTLLVQQGTLKIGDAFVVGIFSGRIRAMHNDRGENLKIAGPSTPVEITGLSGVPAAGDPFEGVESDRMAKQVSQKRLEFKRIESAKKVKKVTLESLNDMIKDGEVKELKVLVKADVDGSAQALEESLVKLSTDEIRVNVVHCGTGGINESDVMLASASEAVILGFHVRPTGKVAEIADRESVSIKYYNIIFEATDDIKLAMEGMLSPVIEERVLGNGEIKQVFKISKIGTIAGAFLDSGKVEKGAKMRLVRDGVVVFDGAMKSLKRYKDDVNSVIAGQDFGFALDGYNDLKEGDTFEAYKMIEIAKSL